MITYVYKVTLKETGEFYYGSRLLKAANKRPEDDLFVKYFTSSKIIKSLIKMHGISSFTIEVLFVNNNYGEGYFFEQSIIKDNIKNPLCLNKQYFDVDQNKTIFSNFGNTHSATQKEKWSKERKGVPPPNKGIKYSPEKKLNFQNKNKGKTYDEIYGSKSNNIKKKIKFSSQKRLPIREETREKLKAVHARRTPESYKQAGEKLKNRVFTEDTLAKMSKAKKGKPAHNKGIPVPKVSCIICQKECDVRNLGRYHKH